MNVDILTYVYSTYISNLEKKKAQAAATEKVVEKKKKNRLFARDKKQSVQVEENVRTIGCRSRPVSSRCGEET